MNTDPKFSHAIESARQSLRNGDRRTARQWAERAVTLDEGAEEGWLLLAATSSPRAGVGYAQRALAINPESERAQRALQSAMKQLGEAAPATGRVEATPRPKPMNASARGQPSKSAPRRNALVPALLIGLACLFILALTAFSVSAAPKAVSALQRLSQPTATSPAHFAWADIAKPTFTPTPTITPSPTLTPLPTATLTPGAIEAAIVADTPTPEYVSAQPGDPAPAYSGDKYILVDISEQHMYVYEGDTLVYSFVASTGMNNATRTGSFQVQSKIPNAYGATWNIWMPHWLGIYWSGGLENGIHALPILPNGSELWAGFLGRPISYGCVVLGSYEAGLLYDWAEIGTPVEIQW